MPDWRFFDRDGLMEVDLGPEWPGFTETLADSLGTRAPRGHPEGLSTFWLDRMLERLDAWVSPGTELGNGNATELIRTDSGVRAASLYSQRPCGSRRLGADPCGSGIMMGAAGFEPATSRV